MPVGAVCGGASGPAGVAGEAPGGVSFVVWVSHRVLASEALVQTHPSAGRVCDRRTVPSPVEFDFWGPAKGGLQGPPLCAFRCKRDS